MAAAASAAAPHDCIRAVQHYVNKILKPRDKAKEISGMKCLLLDKETKAIVAMAYSMNDILAREVYLVESLDGAHESLGHMKAIVLTRPTHENVRELVQLLKEPKFLEYHIFFTNIVPQDLLRKLADADHLGVVRQVQEFYADFFAVNPDTFTLNLGGTLALSRPKASYTHADETALKRCTAGLLALLLSFKVKPYVRYVASSDAAASIAREVAGTVGGERELFTFNRTGGAPLLLIMDRREDPITPLLTQWTYQAMVHELLPGGIRNNRVDLTHAKGVSKDLQEVVLSPADDTFFREHMYANYGDLAASIKALLDEYTSAHKMHESLSSIEDMQRFVDKYPELRSKGLAVGKHVALMGEMSAAVDSKRLMELSEIEQNVACSDNPNDHLRDVQTFLTSPNNGTVDPFDALRLFMIYALRYERARPDKVAELRRFVSERLDMQDSLNLADALLSYGGAAARSGDLFGGAGGAAGQSVFARLASTVKRSVAGVQNVYTQHQPQLTAILDALARGKLSRTTYPFVGAEPPPGKFSTVIVFYVGGTTYEEAAKVADINAGRLQIGTAAAGAVGAGAASGGAGGAGGGAAAAPPFRVVLGGSHILSAKSFLAELQRISSPGGGSVAINVHSADDLR